jgi:tetratricopeptide (TPR) repeat protein
VAAKQQSEDLKLLKQELKHQLRLRGHIQDLDAEFGKAHGYFYNRFSGEAQISLQLALEVSKVLKLRPAVLFHNGDLKPLQDPVALLLSRRERQELPKSPFLDDLAPRISGLLTSEVARHIGVSSERPVLEAIEEQRFGDRIGALHSCERLIAKILGALESIDGSRPRELVGELAAALALWATIQRSRGLRDLALKAFTHAFPVAKLSCDPVAHGTCYQRASYLLRDYDRPNLGYGFILEAFLYFSGGESFLNLWKCHIDRGFLLGSCGELEESNSAFELALERLPGREWRNRVGALQGLGRNARLQKRFKDSRELLISAAAECQKKDLLLGHVLWSRAITEFELKEMGASRTYFTEAIALLGKFGSAGDVALICADFVEVLLVLKDRQAAVKVITDVVGWLPALRANPILCRALNDFLDLSRSERIGLAGLPKVRENLKKALMRGEIP